MKYILNSLVQGKYCGIWHITQWEFLVLNLIINVNFKKFLGKANIDLLYDIVSCV